MTPDSVSSESASAQKVQLIEALGSDRFKIVNTNEVLLNAIEIIDVVEFRSQSEKNLFRVIVTGPTAATDYGAYKRLVLVFNNGYEMPNRTAVFDLGSVGNVNAISRTAADRIQISANLFEVPGQSYPGDVTIDVNLAELLAAEAQQAELFEAKGEFFEGTLTSDVILSVISTSSNSPGYSTGEHEYNNTVAREIETAYGYIWESINYETQQYTTLTFDENRFGISAYSMNGYTNSENFTKIIDLTGSWSAISKNVVEGIYEANNVTVSWTFSDDYSTLVNNMGVTFHRIKVR